MNGAYVSDSMADLANPELCRMIMVDSFTI